VDGAIVLVAVDDHEGDDVGVPVRVGVPVPVGVAVRVVVVDDVGVRVCEMLGVVEGVTQLGPMVSLQYNVVPTLATERTIAVPMMPWNVMQYTRVVPVD
jgi:hypothetical protein